jgi:feruloyl esterase
MQRSFAGAVPLGAAVILAAVTVSAAADTCETLASLELKDTKITAANVVGAGAYVPAKPFFISMPPPYAGLPAFCRVAGRIAPTADSDIAFEVWLPVALWNGKLVAVGNGGYSGEIWFPFMAAPLAAGYVAASTDTGHEGSPVDASFALKHPEKVVDFGERAVHELALKAKAISVAYYGRPPRRTYWNGCSTGGRQGLTEAQRYPTDFDGIIAGAPANYMTRLSAKYVTAGQVIHKAPGNFISKEKLRVLHDAVLAACDAFDGVHDGVIENPMRCRFDPEALHCVDADQPTCLTSAQVVSAQTLYAPMTNPRTQLTLFPGVSAGSELGWSGDVGAMVPSVSPLATGIFEFIVFKKKGWDYRTFDVARDLPIAQDTAAVLDAIDPNLAPFFDRGGKLLQYHGWADPGIPPLNSIGYYERVRAAMAGSDFDRAEFDNGYRLFMVPGMGHCTGGAGPDRFDALGALDAWVESGKPPESIVASKQGDGAVERTRPLCPYPKVATYRGAGSTDDAANFVCASEPTPEPDLSPPRGRRTL